jgi:hypothetical protein
MPYSAPGALILMLSDTARVPARAVLLGMIAFFPEDLSERISDSNLLSVGIG